MKAIPNNPKGFTLVEMLVAMVVGLIVMAGITTTYAKHQRSHVTQQMVVEMQQNARAAMSLMKREIRMAGYDPAATDGVDNEDPDDGVIDEDDADESAGAGILSAEDENFQFTADLSYDPNSAANYNPDLTGPNENITYNLAGTQLQRNGQVVGYDIEAVGFAYAVDEDLDGDLDLNGNGFIKWAFDTNAGDGKLDRLLDTDDGGNGNGVIDTNDAEGGLNIAGPQIPNNRVRAVRIWLLARTRHPIKGHTDNRTYVVGANHRGPDDPDWDPGRRRILLTTTVYCRNLGN